MAGVRAPRAQEAVRADGDQDLLRGPRLLVPYDGLPGPTVLFEGLPDELALFPQGLELTAVRVQHGDGPAELLLAHFAPPSLWRTTSSAASSGRIAGTGFLRRSFRGV